MKIVIYALTFGVVASCTYVGLPFLVRLILRKWLAELPGKLGERLSIDLKDYLGKHREKILPDLKGQVIAHLVEPWIGKFAAKCTDVVASQAGMTISERYSVIIAEIVLKKRLIISILAGHIFGLSVLIGYYINEVI